MPIVNSSRKSGSFLSNRTDTEAGRDSVLRLDSVTNYEAVSSFRTGNAHNFTNSEELVSSKLDPQSEVYKPPSGNLVDQLVYRRNFINRQIVEINSRPGAPANFLLGDVGHEFGTAKVAFTAANNSTRIWGSGFNTTLNNAMPSHWIGMTSNGSTPWVNPASMDPFGGWFGSKGFHFSTQGQTFGLGITEFRAASGNHISMMNPHKSKASVLTTLLELARGDIPSILKSLQSNLTLLNIVGKTGLKDASKTLGKEYLGGAFGWLPLVRDIQKALETLLVIDKLLFPSDSTRRNVDKVLRTRGNIINDVIYLSYNPPFGGDAADTSNWSLNSAYRSNPASTSNLTFPGALNAQHSVLEELTMRTSARFNTTMRPNSMNNGYLDRAIELLGLELTPEVLWQLTPWTWLIDWFSNIGTVIGNLTTLGLSNTILQYAYSTARWKTSVSVNAKPQQLISSGTGIRSFTGTYAWHWQNDYKVRIAASPFGFDVGLDSLSAYQWTILTALGLARSR